MCSPAESSLSDDNAIWVRTYAEEVVKAYAADFAKATERFKDGEHLIQRFSETVNEVLTKGRHYFSAVDEAHNELCVASSLLANQKLIFRLLQYEPSLPGCTKSIDFIATADDGNVFYVDVKTVRPQRKDRWDQFEKAKNENWIAENVNVMIAKDWLGGEIWHSWFAARARMLEYTLELERKISECKISEEKNRFALLLCGDGFFWHEDQLEDFVSFYQTGIHRDDDPFSLVESKYIRDNAVVLHGSIERFAYLNRIQGAVQPRRLNWNVQPPKWP